MGASSYRQLDALRGREDAKGEILQSEIEYEGMGAVRLALSGLRACRVCTA